MAKTIVLQIGNSDNKLTQFQWSEFIRIIHEAIEAYRGVIHFAGGSASDKAWQNYCWVFELDANILNIASLRKQLVALRKNYKQDSIAWIDGTTVFI